MNYIESIKQLPVLRNFFPAQTIPESFIKKDSKGTTFELKGNRTYKYELDTELLDRAIAQALDPENPSREMLYNIYDSLRDLHVKSQIRTAVFKVISQAWFIVDSNNEPNKELTELFKKKWFNDLNKLICETEFWSHSLIYFLMDIKTGEFTETKLFPRMHVNPAKKMIIPDLNFPEKQFSYNDNELLKNIFIEVESTEKLGLLSEIARYSIYKKYAIGDWARSSEKWGDPHVILKSASQTSAEDDAKEGFLKNLGNNGYAIVEKDDELELLERNSTGNSHLLFLDFIKLNNDENSKGINGQTATTDQQAFVGSAEVQERILNDYTLSRLKDLMFFHNEITIPFLINYNNGNSVYSKLKGYRWMPQVIIDEESGVAKKKKEDPNNGSNNGLNNIHNPFL